MDCNNRQSDTINHEHFAVVLVAAEFLSNVLSLEDRQILRSNHGLSKIRVHILFFDSIQNMICALISSPDMPEIVAYHRIMEDLEYYKLGDTFYPVVGLKFQNFQIKPVDTPPGQMDQWFSCEDEDEEASGAK